MSQEVRPFLMFQDGCAETAMIFYAGLFSNGEILKIEKYGPEGQGPEGTVVRAVFQIGDQQVMCSDSPIKHAFDFTPSSSLFVTCSSKAEIEQLFSSLSDGGEVLMPLDNYGFSEKFGWVNDRFGVSWQLNFE